MQANSLQKPESFDLYVRKFRAICAMHNVRIGSRADLPGFMQKLAEDRHFAMEFWKLVGKLSNREGGELTDDQMLVVLVESVTGSDISQEDGDLRRTVDDLRALLAGVDVQSPGQSQVELAPFPRSGMSSPSDASWRKNSGESSAETLNSRAAFTADTADGEAAALSATPPAPVDEAMQWLEQTDVQLKQYRENIAKRMSKLESNPNRPIAKETAAPDGKSAKPVDESISDSISESIPTTEPILRQGVQSRLVLESTLLPVEDFKREREDLPKLSTRFPLDSFYSEPEGHGKALLSLLLVVALIGAGFGAYRYRVPLRDGITALTHKIQNRGTGTSANQNATTAAASENDTSDQPKQGQTLSDQPPAASPSLPADGGVASFPGQAPAVTTTLEPNSHKAMPDHVAIPGQRVPADVTFNADEARAIRVAASTMETNLIVSRVPAYPEIAKSERVAGHVTMQAIISKEGIVKRVHVIEGDSRLRSAAIEAVYKWRYRPYLLNGQPVDVATTITVDFKLDR